MYTLLYNNLSTCCISWYIISLACDLVFSIHKLSNFYLEKRLIKCEMFSDVEGKVPEHRITGQYRNKSSLIWDPHPQYLIDAFGVHFHLILYQDNNFIPKHLKVSFCEFI